MLKRIAHNSVFADDYEAGQKGASPSRRYANPLTSRSSAGKGTSVDRGYSSAGRAVALQAIGQGFESPYLQLKRRERVSADNAANGILLAVFTLDTGVRPILSGL
jgi:hypothetical protein